MLLSSSPKPFLKIEYKPIDEINIPSNILALSSSAREITLAPIITPGNPIAKNFNIKGFSKFILVINLLVAPIPNATVAIL